MDGLRVYGGLGQRITRSTRLHELVRTAKLLLKGRTPADTKAMLEKELTVVGLCFHISFSFFVQWFKECFVQFGVCALWQWKNFILRIIELLLLLFLASRQCVGILPLGVSYHFSRFIYCLVESHSVEMTRVKRSLVPLMIVRFLFMQGDVGHKIADDAVLLEGCMINHNDLNQVGSRGWEDDKRHQDFANVVYLELPKMTYDWRGDRSHKSERIPLRVSQDPSSIKHPSTMRHNAMSFLEFFILGRVGQDNGMIRLRIYTILWNRSKVLNSHICFILGVEWNLGDRSLHLLDGH